MKRIITLLAIATFASCSIFAQDDMYFTPKSKAVKEKEKAEAMAAREKKLAEQRAAEAIRKAKQDSIDLAIKKEWFRKNRHRISKTEDGNLVYHRGRDCSDDEYNRRGKFASSYTVVSDSTANDIIEFTPGDGQYPDSLIASIDTTAFSTKKMSTDRYDDDEDDYYFSRRMNRFDGFYGSSRYWLLYNNPWYSHWAYDPFFWNDPWYWNRSWVYDPWYWNDPWYYGGYYSYYGGYYGGWGGYYATTYIPHRYHHVHYTPVVLGGTTSIGRGGNYIASRTTHGTQAPRQGYRSFSSDLKSYSRYDNGQPGGRVTKDPNFIGYRGNRSNRSTSNDSGTSSSARDYSQRSYTTSSARDYSQRSYSNGSSSSSSSQRTYSSSSSRDNSSRSFNNSSSSNSNSSRSFSNSSSSSSSSSFGGSRSSSSSGGGSFGGSRGGGGGGGIRHGGSR